MQNNFLTPVLFVLIIVLVLLSIVTIAYVYITAKNRERLALIQMGMNPNLSRSDFWPNVGIIGGGIGAGLIIGDMIGNIGPLLAILIPGIGLVIYNLARKSKMIREK